jgi:hypothetical protein
MVMRLASEKGKRSSGKKGQKARKVGELGEKEWATTITTAKYTDKAEDTEIKKDRSHETISMDELWR